MSNPPRVAVVGCGYWGRNLVRNFAELGALAAVCDPSQRTRDELSGIFGVPGRDWSEILADNTIQAAVIAAPAVLHHRLAREALEAGKHVFVEKPLSLELTGAEELCDLAAHAGLTLMVGHLLQYHPAFIRLTELVEEGTLGKLEYVYSNRLNLGKFRREEDILWSFAPHDISMILRLMGSAPNDVDAIGSFHLHPHIADVTTTHMAFPGGRRAHVFVSWLHPFKEQKLVVVGEDGMAVFDDGEPWERKLLVYAHSIDWVDGVPTPLKADAVAVALQPSEPLRDECQHFLSCVANGTRPVTDGREGLRVLKVVDAAARAVRERSLTGQRLEELGE